MIEKPTDKFLSNHKLIKLHLKNQIPVGRLFLRATNFAKRAKALFSGNYFRALRTTTYMIKFNSCIYVIFRLNNFRVKQKVVKSMKIVVLKKQVPNSMCTIANPVIIYIYTSDRNLFVIVNIVLTHCLLTKYGGHKHHE